MPQKNQQTDALENLARAFLVVAGAMRTEIDRLNLVAGKDGAKVFVAALPPELRTAINEQAALHEQERQADAAATKDDGIANGWRMAPEVAGDLGLSTSVFAGASYASSLLQKVAEDLYQHGRVNQGAFAPPARG